MDGKNSEKKGRGETFQFLTKKEKDKGENGGKDPLFKKKKRKGHRRRRRGIDTFVLSSFLFRTPTPTPKLVLIPILF